MTGKGFRGKFMLEAGSVVEGKVVRIMPFGAFVEIERKQSGLVHISEISSDYVKDINDHVKIGDTVMVKVISIDEKGRMGLSIKQASDAYAPKHDEKKNRKRAVPDSRKKEPVRPAEVDFFGRSNEELSFEDKLSRFKQDSDEKMLALKRSAESKRSGGYSRRGGR